MLNNDHFIMLNQALGVYYEDKKNSGEISKISRDCFSALDREAEEIFAKRSNTDYTLKTFIGDNIAIYTTHLQAVKKLLKVDLADSALLSLLKAEGDSAIAKLDAEMQGLLGKVLKETVEWEKTPQLCINNYTKSAAEQLFTKLIEAAAASGHEKLAVELKKRSTTVLSAYQPIHVLRDQMTKSQFPADLTSWIYKQAAKNLALGEQLIKTTNSLVEQGFSFKEASSQFSSIQKLHLSQSSGEDLSAQFFDSLLYIENLLRTHKDKPEIAAKISEYISKGGEEKSEQIITAYLHALDNADFKRQALELLAKCPSFITQESLQRIVQVCPEQLPFLQQLPSTRLMQLLEAINGRGINVSRVPVIAKLPPIFQAFLIEHFHQKYDWALKFCSSNPELFKQLIELEASPYILTREGFYQWIGKSFTSIPFFKSHPEVFKICMHYAKKLPLLSQDNTLNNGDRLDTLLAKGKGSWIEKIALLFEKDPEGFGRTFTYLVASETEDSALKAFFFQDLNVMQQHRSLYAQLVKLFFNGYSQPTNIQKWALERLMGYAKEGEFFKNLESYCSNKGAEKLISFVYLFEKQTPNMQASLKSIVERGGGVELAYLLALHPISEELDSLSIPEILSNTIKAHDPDIQLSIQKILKIWNKEIAQLHSGEQALLCSLLLLADTDRQKFLPLADISTLFRYPQVPQVLKLVKLELEQLSILETFLKQHPEAGGALLKYLSEEFFELVDDRTSILQELYPHSLNYQQLLACIYAREPLGALAEWVKSKRGLQQPQPFTILDFEISKTAHLEQLQKLLQTATPDEEDYLSQLVFCEIQHDASPLVGQLLGLYPVKYPSLSAMAMQGYEEQACCLLTRIQEKQASRYIEKLVQLSAKSAGRWLSAALKLEAKQSVPAVSKLMEQICDAQEISPFEKNLVYLAAADEIQLLEGLQKDADAALRAWVSERSFTFAKWVVEQDQQNQDPLYKELRGITPAVLQENCLQLYRCLPDSQMRTHCFQWISAQENKAEAIKQLLYLQAHRPANLTGVLEGTPTLDDISSECISTLNRYAKEETAALSHVQKALKNEFRFVVAAADLLLAADGTINKGMISEIKASAFFLENQQLKTAFFDYLDWILNLLETKTEFSERLAAGVVMPSPNTPADKLVRDTLDKPVGQPLSRRDIQVAILSCLLQRPWQSPEVGACFGTSIVIHTHSSEAFLLQTLDDYLELVRASSLTKKGVSFPLATRSVKEMALEHPLAKGREYCIASMESGGTTGLGVEFFMENFTALFDEKAGAIPAYLREIALRDHESYQKIQALQERLKTIFLERCCPLFDPLLIIDHAGHRQSGWTLCDRSEYLLVDDLEGYKALLRRILWAAGELETATQAAEAITLLRQKITNHELIEYAAAKIKDHQPWALVQGGGFEGKVNEYYYDHAPMVQGVAYPRKFQELKMLYAAAHSMPAQDLSEGVQSRFLVADDTHGYTLLPGKLSALKQYKSFDELYHKLSGEAQAFSQIMIDEKLAQCWVEQIGSFLSEERKADLRSHLSAFPLPVATLKEVGWRLIDALQRASVPSPSQYVEQAILNLPELKSKRPFHVIVGDYNWVNDKHDCIYAAYAVSPLTAKLEPYGVEENALEPHYFLGNMHSFRQKIPEPLWKPVYQPKLREAL
jgi:hypothetical protein